MIIEAWHPVTHDLGLIESPAERAIEVFVQWQESLGKTCSIRTATSLEGTLEMLPPLSAEKRRCVFIPTKSSWTGFFQSGVAGSDPFPAMSELSRRLQTRGMRVCSTRTNAKYPATIWELYAPEKLGGSPPLLYRRSICAANDGGRWRFDQSGEPFPFEDTSRYVRPRKRDRFDREILAEYLAHFDVDPFNDDFYLASLETPAFVVERLSGWEKRPPEFTLAQVVAGEPWEKRA